MRTASAKPKDRDVAIPPDAPSTDGAKKVTMFGFRPDADVEEYVNQKAEFDPKTKKRKKELTAIVNDLIRFRIALEEMLGEDTWLELEARALVSKRKPHEVVAELIKQSLKGSKR